jgi:hypothetical protein
LVNKFYFFIKENVRVPLSRDPIFSMDALVPLNMHGLISQKNSSRVFDRETEVFSGKVSRPKVCDY